MKVICINDRNRPKQVPIEKWIKEGEMYTVTKTTLMNIQRNKIGFKLAEIELDQSCFPYEYFSADRFVMAPEVQVKAHQEVKLEEV